MSNSRCAKELSKWLLLLLFLAILFGSITMFGVASKRRTTEYCFIVCRVGDDQLTCLVADGWSVENLGTATEAGIPVLLRRTK